LPLETAKIKCIIAITSISNAAVSQIHPEVNHVIQLAAGIANWGSGNHSTASVHFALLRASLSRQLHMPVLNPIVPTGFGLFGATKKMSAQFSEEVNQGLDQYPNARILFVAHSFGGLLSREFPLRSDEARDRYMGTLTLGTPHLGIEEGKWKGFERTVKNMNAFAADIRSAHAEDHEATGLAMVATTLDIMVPAQSALPHINGKARHLFEHNGLVAHPHAILLTTQLARQMIKEESSRAAVVEILHATA
jgi:pimeloyl-ACP methyl ester carboxylesterase